MTTIFCHFRIVKSFLKQIFTNFPPIIDLENEINADIDQLVDLKRDMVAAIKAVADPECQTLLELRYLCFKSWEQIAVAMGYGVRHVYKLHNSALETFEVPKS